MGVDPLGEKRFGGQAQPGYRCKGEQRDHIMIHLSVAIGRFVEALFWGIFRVAGGVALLVLGVGIMIIAVVAVGSSLWRRRRD